MARKSFTFGQRRPRDDLVIEGFKKTVAVVVGKARLGVDPAPGRAAEGVGCYDAAGDLFGSIDTIGVAGQREHVR